DLPLRQAQGAQQVSQQGAGRVGPGRIVGLLPQVGEELAASELRHLSEDQRTVVVDIMARNATLVAGHDPAPVAAGMLLITAAPDPAQSGPAQSGPILADPALADPVPGPADWAPLVTGLIDVHACAARHPEMLDPAAAGPIAALLRDRIGTPSHSSGARLDAGRSSPLEGALS
nr:hypothetical protein [Actinomycetota bacterium]